jgi:2-hydroxychromene-2-carboxylate isomerase
MTAQSFDLYWSMRSPYCYLSLDRILDIQRHFDVDVNLRVVYPIVIRDPDFFRIRASKHYRPYNFLDSARIAERNGIAYRRPIPDPIIQDLETGHFSDDQPYIFELTRLAALAAREGHGLAFLNTVSRLIWDGSTDNWHQGDHLSSAINRAGLNADELKRRANENVIEIDAYIQANEAAQDAAGHGGVPLMVFEDEPFFGQDRIELLLWRMKQQGLAERS